MKTLKVFMGALLVGAVIFAGCKKDENKSVVNPNTDTEEIEGTEGAVTLVVDLADDALTTTTTDIYFVGKYKDAAGNEYSWNPAPDGSLKMEKVSDTRYKVVLYPTEASETTCNETGEDVTVQCVIAGKATLEDTKGTWGYCWQYSTVAWEGDYQLRAENSKEWRLVVAEDEELGGVITVKVRAWNGDPTATDFAEAKSASIKCASLNGWDAFYEMTALGEGVFEKEVTLVADGDNFGANIAIDGDEANAGWYAQDVIEGFDATMAGKTVKYVFNSKKHILSMKLAE